MVTGASSGIGAATALAFGQRGASVLIHFNRGEQEGGKIRDQIQSAGGKAELLRADLSRRGEVHRMAAALQERPIDILVNNAGSLIRRTRVLDLTDELWDEVMELNLNSAFLIARSVLPGMMKRGRGWIVNVSSVAARNGGGLESVAYASAKGAVSTMTKGLSKKFASSGIQVNAVSPGPSIIPLRRSSPR